MKPGLKLCQNRPRMFDAGSLEAPSKSQTKTGNVKKRTGIKSKGGMANADTNPARNAAQDLCHPESRMNQPAIASTLCK